jgi:hypothetical protein
MNGRLFALDAEDRLLTRLPPPVRDDSEWESHAEAVPGSTFTAHAGLIIAAGHGTPLRWRHV